MKMLGRMRGFILAMALTAAWSASAEEESYLYWLIDWADGYKAPTLDDEPLSGSATAKVVGYTDTTSWSDGVALKLYSDTDLALLGESAAIKDLTWDSPRYAKFGGVTEDNVLYFVELYNDSGEFLGRSTDSISFQQALADGMVLQWDGSSQIYTPPDPWTVTTFVSVPEPNSALLMALGLALVALRRRTHTHA